MKLVEFSFIKRTINALFSRPTVQVLIIAAISVIAYSNTFNYPFAFDDGLYISKNNIINDFRYFMDPASAKDVAHPLSYYALKMRYIGTLTFAVNYFFFGLDVTSYRVMNVIIHLLSTLLIYRLIMLTFRTPFFSLQSSADQSRNIALFSSLFFAVHPIQTQAVTYITQRYASLATMFYLAAIVMYIGWRNESLIPAKDPIGLRKKTRLIFLYLGSLLSNVLAMKTKEIAFTLPVIIALYESMFFCGNNCKNHKIINCKWKRALPRILPSIPFILTMLIIPAGMIEINRPTGEIIGSIDRVTRAQTEISRATYFYTEMRVIITYLRLLFLPINQNLDYDYPVYTSFSDPHVWLSFLCLFIIICFSVYLYYRSRTTSQQLTSSQCGLPIAAALPVPVDFITSSYLLISFGLLWFFITLSVESSLIPIGDVIFEHRLYLPSIGISIAFVTAVFYITNSMSSRYSSRTSQWISVARTLLLITVAILLSIASYQRNSVWKDAITLWNDVVKKSPLKARGHNNLGNYYLTDGQITKAISEFQAAIRLDPALNQARENLVIAFISIEMWDEAQKEALTLSNIAPLKTDPLTELGFIYIHKNMPEEAIGFLQRAIALDPRYDPAFVVMGMAYFNKGCNDKAMEAFNQAIDINPKNHEAFFNRGLLFFSMQAIDQATNDFRTACALGSQKGCEVNSTTDKQ